jgi:hydrogenase expression/formation protein HypC
MCLGIPGRVVKIREDALPVAQVAFGGIVKEVCLAYVPEAQVGDYVIVHVGFAIARLDLAEAERTLRYLDQLGDLDDSQTDVSQADDSHADAPKAGSPEPAKPENPP